MQKPAGFILILIFSSFISYGQKIIVRGQESNGKLEWKDFTGKVDRNSSFAAYTGYKFSTKFSGVRFIGDSAVIDGFEVLLELDPKKSWAKMDKATDALLVHEQGHFNLGILTMKEVLTRFNNARFTKNNYQALLQEIVNEVSKKYNDLSKKYDSETDHSKNKDQQEKWNEFFSRQFAGVN